MSLCVLELNDCGLRLSDGNAIDLRSPGYATLTKDSIITGDAALAQARLHPRQTVSQFWLRLGTEALHEPRPHARHYADLAYAQLQQLMREAGAGHELILAVPGSFSREQLGVLLGIAARCPMRPVGLVDAALAAACDQGIAGHALHIDLQLHQCVLTRLQRQGSELLRERVQCVPGVGLVQLHERWAQIAASRFIQQSRFDPMHSAASEQQLHDRLPAWLGVLSEQDDVNTELHNGSSSYQAKLRLQEMLEAVNPLYRQIGNAVSGERDDHVILLSPRMAALPGIEELLPGALRLEANATVNACLHHAGLIRCEEQALRFVSRLPSPLRSVAPQLVNTVSAVPEHAPQPAVERALPTPSGRTPSHLLIGDSALRLEPGLLHLALRDGIWRLSRQVPPEFSATLNWEGGAWWLRPGSGEEILVDGDRAGEARPLLAGTRIDLPARGARGWRLLAELPVQDDG